MERQNEIASWIADRHPFLSWLKRWRESLPEASMKEIVEEAGGAENVGIVCVDVIVGFCKSGALASPRVGEIVGPIVNLFTLGYSHGIRNFVLPQDEHPPDSPEFEAYGPHCMVGTEETETVPEIKNLPFASIFKVLPKQSINAGVDTEYPDWLEKHRNLTRFIVVGDVTDICIYQTVTYLKARSNQFKLNYQIIVPMDCVDTWDTPVEMAQELGIMPHDAELLHTLFLYHMALNGIHVVRRIT